MSKSYIKGFLEYIILHLIKEEGESYGYALTRKVEERTQGVIKLNEGALYPVLHKLEEQGVLVSELKSEEGRPRKYYRLAAARAAKEHVNNRHKEVADYLAALQAIFQNPSYG
jgi:DNA-binding PadR family transcriptional regulator